MESQVNFDILFRDFCDYISVAQDNLIYFNEIKNRLETTNNEHRNDKQEWNLIQQTVQHFRTILNKFNSDIDMVCARFNKYGVDGEHCSVGVQQQTGEDGKCQITHIVDPQKCICYAIDLNGPIVSQLKKFWKEAPFLRYEPYDETVIGNDMFGIKIDSKLNRAKFVPDTMMNSMRAHLIDTGETVDIELRKLQKLPDDIKSLPATAFRCKINQIGGTVVRLLSDSMKGPIFAYRTRSVDDINDVRHIDIFSTNPFLTIPSDDQNGSCEKLDSDLDLAENIDKSYDDDSDSNVENEQTTNKTLQPKSSVMYKKTLFPQFNLEDKPLNTLDSTNNRNAPTSTGGLLIDVNAVFDGDDASVGAVALDQKTFSIDQKSTSIKNRFDGALSMPNECPIKSKCPPITANGFSQLRPNDRQGRHLNSVYDIGSHMKTQCPTIALESNHRRLNYIPNTGEGLTIIPTHVLNARQFYGQLGSTFNALQYSQQCLNYRRLHFQNEPYSELPDETELVLVLLENGSFYRAKVLNVSINREITVFLVDYGTTHRVDLRYIYKWTNNCEKYPFFAVLFTLSNVRISNENDTKIIEFIKEKIPKTFTSAEVNKVDDSSIFVRIFDDNGFDIGDEISCISNT